MLRLPNLNLGELEIAALECLWRIGEGDVKCVHAEVSATHAVASNTVQSSLERLFRKNILSRRKVSHGYVYTPRLRRGELLDRAIESLLEITGCELLTAFVDIAARTDAAVLRQLEDALASRLADARSDGLSPC